MSFFESAQKKLPRTLFDDRLPAWNRTGMLPVARRRVLLRTALAERGVFRYSSPEISERLGRCSLAELRRLHTYTSGGTVGSMNIRLERANGGGVLADVHDPGYTAPISKGATHVDLDFRPFNVHHKIDELVTTGIFFLFTDLTHAIDEVNTSGVSLPTVVTGSTNLTLARLTMRRAGFRAFGARIAFADHMYELSGRKVADIMAGNERKILAAARADTEVHIFMRTEDFSSEEMRKRCAAAAATAQRRLVQPGETPEALESRLRIMAIDMSLRVMQPMDVVRLARHTARRDLVHTEIAGMSPIADARREIASWQPQIPPNQFTPPDYYAK